MRKRRSRAVGEWSESICGGCMRRMMKGEKRGARRARERENRETTAAHLKTNKNSKAKANTKHHFYKTKPTNQKKQSKRKTKRHRQTSKLRTLHLQNGPEDRNTDGFVGDSGDLFVILLASSKQALI